ncbi:MAG: guanylate kinase [Gammaproteobacteria bacterium]|nr:guanylate kinase [Gammaproteobacteria bacterium]
MPHHPGELFVISAPSGAGKTSLVTALTYAVSDLTISISHTTRAPRPGEINGVNYWFIDDKQFRAMIAENKFLEYATVFGNLYGTSRQWVEETLATGKDVILEIDWQGCQKIHALFPECTSIFIVPPSPEVLAARLTERKQDSIEIIQQRLADVKETFAHLNEYHYVVLNDDFEDAVNELAAIVQAKRLTRERQLKTLRPLLEKFV